MERKNITAIKAISTAAALATAAITLTLSTVSCNNQSFKTEALSAVDSLALSDFYPIPNSPHNDDIAYGTDGDKHGTDAWTDGIKPALRIDINIEYATGGAQEDVIRSVNGIIAEMLFGEEELTDVQESYSKYVENLKKTYREDCSEIIEMSKEFGESMIPVACNWASSIQGQFLKAYKGYIPYRSDTYNYTGGAHGGRTVLCRNFNFKSGEAASEDDIFKENYEEKLTALLVEKAVEYVGEENAEVLWKEEIKPNGNFVLSKEGILYIFNQYEIAPYAAGVIELDIPWDEVADIVK